MQYKPFGNTGLKISALSFGTMTFGTEADENTSKEIYKACREAGINHFDCADVYSEGKAEEILGRFIKEERDQVIISSKVYFPSGKDMNSRGLSRKHIILSLHESLKRLQTDYIDLYYLHRFDEETPLEESLETLSIQVKHGKILYLGLSNFAAWQIMKALGISTLNHFPSFKAVQPMYNLLKRQAEVEILPAAHAEDLAVIPYNPLAGGVLTGKYSKSTINKGTRLEERELYKKRYLNTDYFEIADRFVALAKEKGYSPASLAIAWVMGHKAITSPLLGARNLEQLKDCLKAIDIPMTLDLRKEINKLTAEPPCATDRSEETS